MSTLLLSPVERDYITKGIEKGIRADGRDRLDWRHLQIRQSIISQANGSARCRLGNLGFGTDILVGIKAEIGQYTQGDSNNPSSQKIVCNVECSPSAMQEFEGRGADEVNLELSQLLDRLLNGPQCGIDFDQLCIIPKQAYWVLYVDALVLDYDGNPIDALMMTTRAALADTRLPKVVVESITDENGVLQQEFEVVDDPQAAEPLKGRDNIPLTVTLYQIGGNYVVDTGLQEELCTKARLTVSVNPAGEICGIQKSHTKSGFAPSALPEMLKVSQKQASVLFTKLENELAKSSNDNQMDVDDGDSFEPDTGSTFLVPF
ncbi:hypothetical protein H4219_004412 [Mycoemilia scoparia]|uniref:Ribosomal RNA-processing protein 42 n=1 Tax=Mycoemilia scoparia TaxID=417184 RepID=A0A9W7ZSE8_9FUNG|nr:hypothetical protein H4219_004412 [Mycoemilia scoparia]